MTNNKDPDIQILYQNKRAHSASQPTPCPEFTSNYFSHWTYQWIQPLFIIGNSKTIGMDDLYELDPSFSAATIGNQFMSAWLSQKSQLGNGKNNIGVAWRLFITIWKAFSYDFMKSGVYLFGNSVLGIASPIVLQRLLLWLSTYDTVPHPAGGSEWEPYVLGVALFIMQVFSSLFLNWHYELAFKTGFKIRTALTMTLYQKTFTLSPLAKQDYSTGRIVNIITTDTYRLDLACQYLHMIWGAPLLIIMATVVLYLNLGIAALSGFGFIILYIPVQYYLSKSLTIFRRHANKLSDSRMKVIHETLKGIRVIKMYAWETPFLKLISKIRKQEIRYVRLYLASRAITSSVTQTIPAIAMIITFVLYYYLGNELTVTNILPSLALFYALRVPMLLLPIAIGLITDSYLALNRVGDLLLAEELSDQPRLNTAKNDTHDSNVQDLVKNETAIKILNASFEWETNHNNHSTNHQTFKIQNVNIDIKQGNLIAIVGSVGSGKSSLLNALIGEMKKTKGEVIFNGFVGYCQQQAWIQNTTLRNNILFGKPYDKKKFDQTIKMCCLERDLNILVAGDQTEIGENGINLSGGQKQRVSIARAIYSDTDILLLDDPLSAVDAHVGKTLFEECIKNKLKDKTRILVTHQLHFLPLVDFIIFMDKGEIVAKGNYSELIETCPMFTTLMSQNESESETKNNVKKLEFEVVQNSVEVLTTNSSPDESLDKDNNANITQAEEREIGRVGTYVVKAYLVMAGGAITILLLLLWIGMFNVARILTDQWLVYWINNRFNMSDNDYIKIYAILGASQVIVNVAYGLSVAYFGAKASERLHNKAIKEVFKCPIGFFDSTPLGRITSRFSRDVDNLDTLLPESIRTFIATLAMCFCNMVLISTYLPLFSIPSIIVFFVYYKLQGFYMATARELKRLDSISRSPLIAQIAETLAGLATIRSYNAIDFFALQNTILIDENNRPLYLILIVQRWIQLRLDTLNSVLVLLATLFTIYFRHNVNAGLSGLIITYALQITATFTWCMKSGTDAENYLNSAERMNHYVKNLKSEGEALLDSNNPPKEWPNHGHIKADNLMFKYLPHLPYVLRNVSFEIQPGTNIGIIGRTGAGKSTIFTTLLRLVELESGKILVDGIDISTIGLSDLRSNIAVIPQEPVLFSGTVRTNLDPFSEYTDDQIWDALQRSNLHSVVSELPLCLDSPVSENGENWSTGQRQLICLARALLKNAKIILLDEATASVDFATDEFIQTAIRRDFTNATVITIAHRLNTIADYDKIMVLSFGEIVEFDHPYILLADQNSEFSKMVAETGEVNASTIMNIANKSAKK